MKNLVKLAILGSNLETIATNIAEMNPSVYIAERIISGIPTVTIEQCQKYLESRYNGKDKTVIDFKITHPFEDACLCIKYREKKTQWFKQKYEVDENNIAKEDLRYKGTDRQDDDYCYQYTFYSEYELHAIPEEL